MPPLIGSVVNTKLATLYELQTVYSLEDLYDLYEVAIIKIANEQKMLREAKQKRGKR